MGRPLQFDKAEALGQALQIFWRKGYESASLLDLIEAMNLSKSSFYQSYTSKKDLFSLCLSEYQNQLTLTLTDKLNAAGSGRDFIAQTLAEIITESSEEYRRKGCFLMNTATMTCAFDESVSNIMESGFAGLEKVFQTAIERAQSEGDIPINQNPQILANFIVCNIIGLRTMIKAGTNQDILQSIAANVLSSIT